MVNAPVPLALGLSVLVNPQMVARSLQAYLHVIAGISNVLAELELADDSVIESEVAVAPSTQEATIQRLAAVRRFTLDLASPDQWTALIMAMPQQQVLLTQIWELLAK
jgi:hypothetical protein